MRISETISPNDKVPVFINPDVSRDSDDALAIVYLAGSPNVEIVGISTTYMIPDRRAFLARQITDGLGLPDMPIGVGSTFSLDNGHPEMEEYLRKHRTPGMNTWEGIGLVECFRDGVDLMGEAVGTYGSELRIAALGPLTDVAKVAAHDPAAFRRIQGLYYQGQAIIDKDGRLQPDPIAYNTEKDEEAARQVFAFQDDVPITLVGKFAAYKVPFNRDDFIAFDATGNPAGHHLRMSAETSITQFAKEDPSVFTRVYKVPPEDVDNLYDISNPYDVIVAKSIANPTGLAAQHVGHHTLIGMAPDEIGSSPRNHGVEDPAALKYELITTIMDTLQNAVPAQAFDRYIA